VGLLIAYFVAGEILHGINFSFALVALGTARILNWRKQRLEIRTELIRNLFLFTGAIMVLFSLHEAVPPNFVTLSWTLSAMVFFILSVAIRNMKYRWLAIITMVVTVFYLFIVDLSNISLGYRIVALMFIAAISLGISIFYARRQKSKKEESE
jgi:predicted RND superfamily exporter protein